MLHVDYWAVKLTPTLNHLLQVALTLTAGSLGSGSAAAAMSLTLETAMLLTLITADINWKAAVACRTAVTEAAVAATVLNNSAGSCMGLWKEEGAGAAHAGALDLRIRRLQR